MNRRKSGYIRKIRKISKFASRHHHSKLYHPYIFLAVIVVCAVLVLPSKIVSSASTDKTNTRYFKSVQIQPGDSLWSIAADNYSNEWESIDSYIAEIKRVNGLSEENIHTGNYIAVPYYAVHIEND